HSQVLSEMGVKEIDWMTLFFGNQVCRGCSTARAMPVREMKPLAALNSGWIPWKRALNPLARPLCEKLKSHSGRPDSVSVPTPLKLAPTWLLRRYREPNRCLESIAATRL